MVSSSSFLVAPSPWSRSFLRMLIRHSMASLNWPLLVYCTASWWRRSRSSGAAARLLLERLDLRGFGRLALDLQLGPQLFLGGVLVRQAHGGQHRLGLIQAQAFDQGVGVGQGDIEAPAGIFPGLAQR